MTPAMRTQVERLYAMVPDHRELLNMVVYLAAYAATHTKDAPTGLANALDMVERGRALRPGTHIADAEAALAKIAEASLPTGPITEYTSPESVWTAGTDDDVSPPLVKCNCLTGRPHPLFGHGSSCEYVHLPRDGR